MASSNQHVPCIITQKPMAGHLSCSMTQPLLLKRLHSVEAGSCCASLSWTGEAGLPAGHSHSWVALGIIDPTWREEVVGWLSTDTRVMSAPLR
jgi:hypothetical protein